jgi:hypothetical protein
MDEVDSDDKGLLLETVDNVMFPVVDVVVINVVDGADDAIVVFLVVLNAVLVLRVLVSLITVEFVCVK